MADTTPPKLDTTEPAVSRWDLRWLAQTMASLSRLEEFLQGGALDVDAIMLLAQLKSSTHFTVGELASALGLSPSKMSRLVLRLLDTELIAEHPSRSDARKSVLRITGRGRNVLFEVEQELGKDVLSDTLERRTSLRHAQRAALLYCDARLSFTDMVILIALSFSPSGLNVSELGAHTLFSQPRVSMSLRALRKRGIVRSIIMPDDRRQRTYQLAPKGQNILDACVVPPREDH